LPFIASGFRNAEAAAPKRNARRRADPSFESSGKILYLSLLPSGASGEGIGGPMS
jgi:hypothetical protein